MGYSSLATSALENKGIEELKELLKDSTTLLSGHSGVGKSTLINRVQPGLDLKTSAVSDYNEKGKHTTTFAEMFGLDIGGDIIDTPGIKSFGLVDIEKEELANLFPEMRELRENCRFHNCLHIHEPGCAIKAAVEETKIAFTRYESYLGLYQELEESEIK